MLFLILHLLIVWGILTDKFVKKVAFIARESYITELFCIIHCVLVLGACVVAVRSCLHRESWFVVTRWST